MRRGGTRGSRQRQESRVKAQSPWLQATWCTCTPAGRARTWETPCTWLPGPVADCWVCAKPGPARALAEALLVPLAEEKAADGSCRSARPAEVGTDGSVG